MATKKRQPVKRTTRPAKPAVPREIPLEADIRANERARCAEIARMHVGHIDAMHQVQCGEVRRCDCGAKIAEKILAG